MHASDGRYHSGLARIRRCRQSWVCCRRLAIRGPDADVEVQPDHDASPAGVTSVANQSRSHPVAASASLRIAAGSCARETTPSLGKMR
jgi:hypothetical protein